MKRFLLPAALVAFCVLALSRVPTRGDEADAAKTAYWKKMTAAATAQWEAISKGLATEEGFDPQNPAAFKGKLIKVETDNLMGYRFKPGDFAFATTLDGNPVAGKYDPVVAKAVKQIEATLGRSLGDNDDDGKWTIIARVEGTKGKLTTRPKEAGERAEMVDAPIITIIAAHCGPLAASKEKGMAKADGSVGAP